MIDRPLSRPRITYRWLGAVSPVRWQWGYYSLALSHWYIFQLAVTYLLLGLKYSVVATTGQDRVSQNCMRTYHEELVNSRNCGVRINVGHVIHETLKFSYLHSPAVKPSAKFQNDKNIQYIFQISYMVSPYANLGQGLSTCVYHNISQKRWTECNSICRWCRACWWLSVVLCVVHWMKSKVWFPCGLVCAI